MDNAAGPGPLIVLLLTESGPEVRRIVPVTLKSMVSPEAASAIACLREPAPESLVLVTVRVVAWAAPWNTTRVSRRARPRTTANPPEMTYLMCGGCIARI